MSLTDEVFGAPDDPNYMWVYYPIKNPRELVDGIKKKHPVVVMFWADRNRPCSVMMDPFWDMACKKFRDAAFCQVDTHKFKDLVAMYKVEALPTFLLIKGGTVCGRVVGPKVPELNTTIENNI